MSERYKSIGGFIPCKISHIIDRRTGVDYTSDWRAVFIGQRFNCLFFAAEDNDTKFAVFYHPDDEYPDRDFLQTSTGYVSYDESTMEIVLDTRRSQYRLNTDGIPAFLMADILIGKLRRVINQ